MSLYSVRKGTYRVKRLDFGYKLRKRLENLGFGVGSVIQKAYSPKTKSQTEFLTSEGKISLTKRITNSIIVEKVDK